MLATSCPHCGVETPPQAARCQSCGFVFFERSPRNIAPSDAAALRALMPKTTRAVAVVVDATEQTVPALATHRVTGFLGLQNHNEEVRFRNIRLGAAQ